MEIMGESFELMGWYEEKGFTNFIIMKEGNIKPHLLMAGKDKYKLFGPLGNSLPAQNIELQEVVKTLREEKIINV